MRMEFVTVATLGLMLAGSAACATRGYVKKEVAQINDKMTQNVDTMSQTVEQTQERTRKNETQIAQAGQKAEQAGLWARDAGTAAATAQIAANDAGARADAVDRASKRMIFEVVLSEDQGNFAFGKAELPDSAKARIDELVAQLKADPKGAFIEIEGHTDTLGSQVTNNRIGLARAEAVERYFYEKHQVPLHKMSVISFGEDKPIAPNDSRDGRARNRRVVIKVLA